VGGDSEEGGNKEMSKQVVFFTPTLPHQGGGISEFSGSLQRIVFDIPEGLEK
jgi:hypothetical protein